MLFFPLTYFSWSDKFEFYQNIEDQYIDNDNDEEDELDDEFNLSKLMNFDDVVEDAEDDEMDNIENIINAQVKSNEDELTVGRMN